MVQPFLCIPRHSTRSFCINLHSRPISNLLFSQSSCTLPCCSFLSSPAYVPMGNDFVTYIMVPRHATVFQSLTLHLLTSSSYFESSYLDVYLCLIISHYFIPQPVYVTTGMTMQLALFIPRHSTFFYIFQAHTLFYYLFSSQSALILPYLSLLPSQAFITKGKDLDKNIFCIF